MNPALLLIDPWLAWRPATCMPSACFCETVRAALIRQPANAWSSLAFVAVAGVIALQRPSPPTRTGAVVHWAYLAAVLWIGIGSAFYHASLTYWGQFADVSGMYVLATVALLARTHAHRPLGARTIVALFVAANGALLALLWTAPGLRRWVFAALVLAILAQEIAVRRSGAAAADPRLLRQAAGVLLAGFAVWSIDLLRLVCAPGTFLQGHAVWHVLGALAAGLLYLYLFSARAPAVAAGLARPYFT